MESEASEASSHARDGWHLFCCSSKSKLFYCPNSVQLVTELGYVQVTQSSSFQGVFFLNFLLGKYLPGLLWGLQQWLWTPGYVVPVGGTTPGSQPCSSTQSLCQKRDSISRRDGTTYSLHPVLLERSGAGGGRCEKYSHSVWRGRVWDSSVLWLHLAGANDHWNKVLFEECVWFPVDPKKIRSVAFSQWNWIYFGGWKYVGSI